MKNKIPKIACLWLASCVIWSTAYSKPSTGDSYEAELVTIVNHVKLGQLNDALSKVDDLLESYPKSRVGALIKADILSAMAGKLTGFGAGIEDKLKRENFSHELTARSPWEGAKGRNLKEQLIPESIIDMGKDRFVFVGEASTARFFIFGNDNGKPYLVKDYYMAIGKAGFGKQIEGDNKTPLGLYKVTHEIEGESLPDLYGSGAFPVDYPNIVDKWRKRTGYGIWLHGTPSNTYSRAPLSSEGCFVLSNEDYDEVAEFVRQVDNPRVLLVDKINWINQEEHQEKRLEYLNLIQEWVESWESLDTEKYSAYYDQQNLNLGKTDFKDWKQRKKAINKNKSFIQLSLALKSMYIYPGEKDMFAIDFKQNYLSDNYQSVSDKTIYWKKSSSGKWKIIYEGDQV